MKLPDKPLKIIADTWQEWLDLIEELKKDPCIGISAGSKLLDGRYTVQVFPTPSHCKEE